VSDDALERLLDMRSVSATMAIAISILGVPGGRSELHAAPPADDNSICLMIESAARANKLPVEFFTRVIWQESRFNANARGPVTRSGKRAQGIAQFMPGTAAERQLLDPFDPIQALPKAAEFLRDLRSDFGNLGLAAAAYNAGARRVREWLEGIGGMPSETRYYVAVITGHTVEHWKDRKDDLAHEASPAGCATLIASLARKPNPFVAALERRIQEGMSHPWGVQLAAAFSRVKALAAYARAMKRFETTLTGRDPIILRRLVRSRGTRPMYQIRFGTNTRSEAERECNRIRAAGGACSVLRNLSKG
jgi:hypothetical protein